MKIPSVCLSGARGVGKTAIVEAALAKLQKLNNNTTPTMSNRRKPGNQQHKEAKIPVVRLSGLLHAEDNIGMRRWRDNFGPSYQMWDDEEMDDDEVFDNDFVDDIVFSINTAGGMQTTLAQPTKSHQTCEKITTLSRKRFVYWKARRKLLFSSWTTSICSPEKARSRRSCTRC